MQQTWLQFCGCLRAPKSCADSHACSSSLSAATPKSCCLFAVAVFLTSVLTRASATCCHQVGIRHMLCSAMFSLSFLLPAPYCLVSSGPAMAAMYPFMPKTALTTACTHLRGNDLQIVCMAEACLPSTFKTTLVTLANISLPALVAMHVCGKCMPHKAAAVHTQLDCQGQLLLLSWQTSHVTGQVEQCAVQHWLGEVCAGPTLTLLKVLAGIPGWHILCVTSCTWSSKASGCCRCT